MANFPGGTALSGKDGEDAAKAATVQAEEPQLSAPLEESEKPDPKPKSKGKKADNPEPEPEPEEDKISVYLSRMVYRSQETHNSESVKQVQQRLVGLGFVQAGSDQAGLFADGTEAAVAEYQAKHNLDSTGEVDEKTLKALFRNVKGIQVVLD